MGMTFQAFRGSSGAQIAFTILLATSIGDRVTQCTADTDITKFGGGKCAKINFKLAHSFFQHQELKS